MPSPRTQLNDYLARRKHVSDMPPAVRALYYRDMAHKAVATIAENRRNVDVGYLVDDAFRDLEYANARRLEYITSHRASLALQRAIERAA